MVLIQVSENTAGLACVAVINTHPLLVFHGAEWIKEDEEKSNMIVFCRNIFWRHDSSLAPVVLAGKPAISCFYFKFGPPLQTAFILFSVSRGCLPLRFTHVRCETSTTEILLMERMSR